MSAKLPAEHGLEDIAFQFEESSPDDEHLGTLYAATECLVIEEFKGFQGLSIGLYQTVSVYVGLYNII